MKNADINNSGVSTSKEPINKSRKINGNDVQLSTFKEISSMPTKQYIKFMDSYWKIENLLVLAVSRTVQNVSIK